MIQYIYISDASQIYNKFREIGNLKKMLVIKSKIYAIKKKKFKIIFVERAFIYIYRFANYS